MYYRPGSATQSRATARQLRLSLRENLSRKGYSDAQIEEAIKSVDLDAPEMTIQIAFSQCIRTIQQLAVRAPAARNPALSYRAAVASPALGTRARQQLTEMGYTDQQVHAATANGHADVESIIQYLLSPEAASVAPTSPRTASQSSAAANRVTASADGKQLEYMGWLYQTAHQRTFDDTQHQMDGDERVRVPAGWEICAFDKNVRHLCEEFPWGSQALVLLDGSCCLTSACSLEAGKSGSSLGTYLLDKTYTSAGLPIVRCNRKNYDVLLRKQGTLAAEAAVATVAAAADATVAQGPSHSASSAPSLGCPPHYATAESITRELIKQGWHENDVGITIFRCREQSGAISLSECTRYMERNFSRAVAAMVGPPAQTPSTASVSATSQRAEDATPMACRNAESGRASIATHHQEASPPPAAEITSVLQDTVNALLSIGAAADQRHAAVLRDAFPARQGLDCVAEKFRADSHGDPVQELYFVHARWGLQAALLLCHPPFASDDDLMVAAARKSITAEVLAPLDTRGWAVSSVFRALWGGHRHVTASGSARELIDLALEEHPYKTIASLPLAFPFAYAETLAICMACEHAPRDVAENNQVLQLIRAEQQLDATFSLLSRCAENPAICGYDGDYARQLTRAFGEATALKTRKPRAPEVKHFVAARTRRQHRCLCLCTAHLALQSRKLLQERPRDGKAKSENPFQHEIDQLVCVALSAKPSIGTLVAAMFDHPTYQLPSFSQQEADVRMFFHDLTILLQYEQAEVKLTDYFNAHLRWLLNAASGVISLSQSMLLDATSADPFAQALTNRSACLRNPLIAATQTASLIGRVSLKDEMEAIKQHLSDFDGLSSALDHFWSSAPASLDQHSARLDANLAATSSKSARWLLAVERTWSKKLAEVKEQALMLHPSPNSSIVPPIVRWSVQQQIPMMKRAVKLLKGSPRPADEPSSMIVEGTTNDELNFFVAVAAERLVEAGFIQVKPFLEELLRLRSQGAPIERSVDLVSSNAVQPASAEWIFEFRKLWISVS